MNSISRIGTLIRSTREEMGISQAILAERLGWKQPMLSRLESGGRKNISVVDLQKICLTLNIEINALLPKPYFETNQITLFKGDAEKTLLSIEDESVDCVVTSPPYYGLRDYEIEDQIGLEEHPETYIQELLKIFRQVKRVLKPTGSVWVNIGDTFWSGKGKSQGTDRKQRHRRFDRPQDKAGNPPLCVPKQRLLIPHRFAISMQDDGWIVRGDNVWHKPNPVPDPVSDRCAIAHEYVFHFVKQKKYFFDADAVAIPSNGDKLTKPPQSVWNIKTSQSSKMHKAVFPEALVELPIRATCPAKGVILDPFCGSGTALYVAIKESLNRKAIGIDLSEDALNEAKELFLARFAKNI